MDFYIPTYLRSYGTITSKIIKEGENKYDDIDLILRENTFY